MRHTSTYNLDTCFEIVLIYQVLLNLLHKKISKFHPGKSLVLSSNEIGVKKIAAVSSRRSAGSCLIHRQLLTAGLVGSEEVAKSAKPQVLLKELERV